ncbi:MAG: hypothetical protein R3B70_03750 [Polyangiaceae bacterium]
MTTRVLSILFASALLFPQITGCVAGTGEGDDLGDGQSDVSDDMDSDEAEDDLGSAASALSNPNVFFIRHGETKDGENITAAGKIRLQQGWGSVPCSLIANAQIRYLYSTNDLVGSDRYVQTKAIVKEWLNSVCPGAGVTSTKLYVADLRNFTGPQAQEVYDKMTETSSRPRIFVLGSHLLHKFTEASDCSLPDKTDCYFRDWPAILTLWKATRALDECQLGVDPNDRRFMYNFIYRFDPTYTAGQDVQHAYCVGSKRIPLNTYSSSKCTAQWDNLIKANTCSW